MSEEVFGLDAWVASAELGGPVCIAGSDESDEALSVNLYTSADNQLIGVQVTRGCDKAAEVGLVPPDTFS